MSPRPRKPARVLTARKMSLRAPTQLADDTEKLMSNSTDSRRPETDLARLHTQSHSKLSKPASHHDYSDHEITDVPAPIPDTGLPPSADASKAVTSHASASHTLDTSSIRPSKTTFVPLPSLKTQNLTEIEEEATRSSSVTRTISINQSAVATKAVGEPHGTSHTSHLSTAAIIALALAGGCVLLVVVVLVKLVKRPRKRKTPTPSLPFLHDGTFPHDKVESEGSPVFGGKEHLSPTLQARGSQGNTGIWTWTQYNSGIPKPAPTVTVTRSSSQDRLPAADHASEQRCFQVANDCDQGQIRDQYPFVGYGNSKSISKTMGSVPLQPVQNAITRAVSRLSTVSMSLYPNSPGGYSQVAADVGLAIDGVTHDEHEDETAALRNRTSMIATGSVRGAAALRRSQSFAYGGIEPISPSTATPGKGQFSSGRARIKSTYYAPCSYPRTSAAAGKHDADREQDAIHPKRVEQAQARDVTMALGLKSPVPPSPQPTLYPDDSMSVIEEAKKMTLTGRSQKKPVPKASSQCDGSPSDTAALGSLMMVDFAVSKSTASLVNIRPSEAARAREGQGGQLVAGKSNLKKRVEDKPPRVPSPPLMPSLAQMAMQHADADYHSPTYSIYGLYDGDRKSRRISHGY